MSFNVCPIDQSILIISEQNFAISIITFIERYREPQLSSNKDKQSPFKSRTSRLLYEETPDNNLRPLVLFYGLVQIISVPTEFVIISTSQNYSVILIIQSRLKILSLLSHKLSYDHEDDGTHVLIV